MTAPNVPFSIECNVSDTQRAQFASACTKLLDRQPALCHGIEQIVLKKPDEARVFCKCKQPADGVKCSAKALSQLYGSMNQQFGQHAKNTCTFGRQAEAAPLAAQSSPAAHPLAQHIASAPRLVKKSTKEVQEARRCLGVQEHATAEQTCCAYLRKLGRGRGVLDPAVVRAYRLLTGAGADEIPTEDELRAASAICACETAFADWTEEQVKAAVEAGLLAIQSVQGHRITVHECNLVDSLQTSYTTEYRVEVLHPLSDATRWLILSFRDSDVYQWDKLPYWLLYNAWSRTEVERMQDCHCGGRGGCFCRSFNVRASIHESLCKTGELPAWLELEACKPIEEYILPGHLGYYDAAGEPCIEMVAEMPHGKERLSVVPIPSCTNFSRTMAYAGDLRTFTFRANGSPIQAVLPRHPYDAILGAPLTDALYKGRDRIADQAKSDVCTEIWRKKWAQVSKVQALLRGEEVPERVLDGLRAVEPADPMGRVMSADATLLAHQKKYDEVAIGEVSACLNHLITQIEIEAEIEAEPSGRAFKKRARDECSTVCLRAC